MIRWPFYRALHNPIFQGGVGTLAEQNVRWSHGVNYLIVLSIVLFVTWPRESFLSLRDLPFTYNAVGGSALIILAYLNFSQGARKFLGARTLTMRDWLLLGPIPAGRFLRGYVAVGLLDLFFFWGLSLPLMVIAASVSGESLAHLGAGLLVTLVCVGSYRIAGIALLIVLERDEFLLYILARIGFVFFILISGFIAPLWNPVLAFTDASIWPQHLGMWPLPGLLLQGWVATIVLHLLLGGGFYIIAATRARWMRRGVAAASPVEENSNGE